MKILLCGTSFRPDYGGPARSVAGLADAIAGSGNEVGIWAPDNSAKSCVFLESKSKVKRFDNRIEMVLDEFGPIDLLHDNGIWLSHNHHIALLCKQHRIPRVVSTRGMLETWALRHKWLKKFVAWNLYQRRDLRNSHAIHTTSISEAETVHARKLGPDVWMVGNPLKLPHHETLSRIHDKSFRTNRVALFVGRLHPVKGLPLLLNAWADQRVKKWRLIIAGPDECNHRAQLTEIVMRRELTNQVEFVGPLNGDEKLLAMVNADLFVCPSYTENFGLAIAEALACGLPVITTTGTPWIALRELGIGWYVEPTQIGIQQALADATTSSSNKLSEMGRIGSEYVRRNFQSESIGEQMIRLYRQLLGKRMFR